MSQITINSKVMPDSSIYRGVRLVNSNIAAGCTVGDDSDLVDVIMEEKSELGRRNIVRNSLLGKGTYTGTNTIIKNTKIAKYTCISWDVSIGGGNHEYSHVSLYTDYWFKRTFNVEIQTPNQQVDTFIGNDVWIAAGVIINAGVKIGDGAVIGAGSVVTRDVEPYSVVAGTPAKVIKKRFSSDIIEMLCQLQWWNWSDKKIKENIDVLRNKPNIEILKMLIDQK